MQKIEQNDIDYTKRAKSLAIDFIEGNKFSNAEADVKILSRKHTEVFQPDKNTDLFLVHFVGRDYSGKGEDTYRVYYSSPTFGAVYKSYFASKTKHPLNSALWLVNQILEHGPKYDQEKAVDLYLGEDY